VTALVLLPGLDGTGLLFQPLVEALSKDIEPIVVSYPDDIPLGYGELLPLVDGALPSRPQTSGHLPPGGVRHRTVWPYVRPCRVHGRKS
jgi:hypothetical protein